jgi:hypothetical protein
MIYTAHDSGANLSKLDAISVFLNFLHREYRYHQLLLRGENIYFIHLTHTERERERERERSRDLVRALRLEAPMIMLLMGLLVVKSISALGTSMSWRITSCASI